MFEWLAEYKDGSIIRQNNAFGKIISSDEIDRDKLKTFTLICDNKIIVKLHINNNERLVYRRRVEKTIGDSEIACHIIGWRKLVDNKICQSMMYVFEDGNIEMASDFQENHKWFYPPILRDFELPCQ
jgi:hydroxymethylpyrimidine pyrophosphatase-like HAD family hydrolase